MHIFDRSFFHIGPKPVLMPPDYVCPRVDSLKTQILIGFVFLIWRCCLRIWLRGWPSSSAFPEFPAVFPKPNQVVYAFSLRTEGSCPYPLSGGGSRGPSDRHIGVPRYWWQPCKRIRGTPCDS